MQNKHSGATSPSTQNSPPSGPEVDYSPKTYTPREKLLFGVKLGIICGIIVFLLWLIN